MSNTKETFSNVLYATPLGTRENNCYAWALDYYQDKGEHKLQPGDLSGAPGDVDLSSCSDLVHRALADAKAMGWSLRYLGRNANDVQCPAGHYKIVAVLAPNEDFHWYRHHKDLLYRVKTPRTLQDLAQEFGVPPGDITIPGDGHTADSGSVVLIRGANVWSHKQGFSPDGPLLKDSCGKLIKNVEVACRSYPGLNYTTVCGTFCFDKKNVNRTNGSSTLSYPGR